MAEKDFQTELLRGIRDAGGHAYKIPDAPTSRFVGVQGSRFTPAKPYDCYWVCDGLFHALELKQVTGSLSFALSGLRDQQEESLLAVEAAGGCGWLLVNFRVRLSSAQQKKRGVETVDRAFGARIALVVAARVEDARTGLPLEWWEEHGVELPRSKGPNGISWDPRPLDSSVVILEPTPQPIVTKEDLIDVYACT